MANSWRTTAGLSDTGEPASWDSIIRGLDNNAGLGRFAGPGGWNNMDFLQVNTPWHVSAQLHMILHHTDAGLLSAASADPFRGLKHL